MKAFLVILLATVWMNHVYADLPSPECDGLDIETTKIGWHFSLTPCGKAIKALAKGSRPKVTEYYSQKTLNAALFPFKNGKGPSFLLPRENMYVFNIRGKYNGGHATSYVGYKTGQFVSTTSHINTMVKNARELALPKVASIVDQSKILVQKIEKEIGLPPKWSWWGKVITRKLKDDAILQISFPPISIGGGTWKLKEVTKVKLRLPSGNEEGANDDWAPGGYAGADKKPKHVPEAVCDNLPMHLAEYRVIFENGKWLQPPLGPFKVSAGLYGTGSTRAQDPPTTLKTAIETSWGLAAHRVYYDDNYDDDDYDDYDDDDYDEQLMMKHVHAQRNVVGGVYDNSNSNVYHDDGYFQLLIGLGIVIPAVLIMCCIVIVGFSFVVFAGWIYFQQKK